ncbi:hypothetical protein V1477_009391 [Vespula maculifrons]|uniref:Uncharacterized protein n=1 Tax=Vespula maculifrons TaxID=7453 RepID=A0ABD2C9M2_VESMC
MMCTEVAREILPPPVTLLSPVKNSNFCESVQVSRKPRFVLGSHDVYRGGTVQVSRKPRFVLGSHDVYRGGT